METNLALIATAIVALALYLVWRQASSRKDVPSTSPKPSQSANEREDKNTHTEDAYNSIEPLRDFEWSAASPLKLRPFKPKYHLTMGLENCSLSELLEMDSSYLSRIRLRKEILDAHPEATVQCNETCVAAVYELYAWLFGVYLPQRFPSMYELKSLSDGVDFSTTNSEKQRTPTHLYNKVTETNISLNPSSTREALYTISANIDTDFLFLLPSSTDAQGSPIYHLEAFTCCFPAGFSLLQKISLPLAGIHKPVPGYAAKLEKSMDRFFAKLECGKAVKRQNWNVTTDDRLFTLGGNHLYADEKTAGTSRDTNSETNGKTLDVDAEDIEAKIAAQRKNVCVPDCRLRCERQTLHRLPKSNALVFAFKTYLYPLDEVKMEGNGEALAEAIDGLGNGSVPKIAFYKRGIVWGEKVKEYLRS